MRRVLQFMVAGMVAIGALSARADLFTYTFEGAPFGADTPLLNLTPDVGGSGFDTTFTASPLTDGFEIHQYNGNPSSPFISGQNLLFNLNYFSGSIPPGSLTLAFSDEVNWFSMNIELISGANGVTVSNNLGDSLFFTPNTNDLGTPVIELLFHPGNAFTSVNLEFAATGQPITFVVIDNLAIDAVPEPESYTLIATGGLMICGLLGNRKRLAQRRE